MPLTTPNRFYPYPTDTERIDVAGDFNRLASKIDVDTQTVINSINTLRTDMNAGDASVRARGEEILQYVVTRDNQLIADYIQRDTNLIADLQVQLWRAGLYHRSNILFQTDAAAITLDGFAHGIVMFPIAYRENPAVMLSPASSNMSFVAAPAFEGDLSVNSGGFHVFGSTRGGGNAAGTVVVFYWLAVGYRP